MTDNQTENLAEYPQNTQNILMKLKELINGQLTKKAVI